MQNKYRAMIDNEEYFYTIEDLVSCITEERFCFFCQKIKTCTINDKLLNWLLNTENTADKWVDIDVDGNDIYENDIITGCAITDSYYAACNFTGVIKYDLAYLGFVVELTQIVRGWKTIPNTRFRGGYPHMCGPIKKIGNIYANPELLKTEEVSYE